ncbi:MAG: hypothetical protein K6F99_02355 [Lachnospiraceae bacterium]|nr:hypothetical protein [Lachnospiraceae bacterium]
MNKLDLDTLNMVSGGSEIMDETEKPKAYCKECKKWVEYTEYSGGSRKVGSCGHEIDDKANPLFQ